MEKFSLFIGIDLGIKEFFAAFRQKGMLIKVVCYENSASGIARFIEEIKTFGLEFSQILIALEHCGVYLEKLVMALHSEELVCWLWDPLIAKNAPLDLNRHKDDIRDAKAMALLAEMHQARAKQYLPPTAEQEELKALFRLRAQLVKHRTKFYNQYHANQDKAIPHPISHQILEQWIQNSSEQIQEIEQKIKELIFQSERLKRMHQILLSIPGIGPVLATQLIEITQGFTSFQSEKALAKYAGTLPLEHLSGSSVKRKPRSSKKCYKPLKVNLTMGATSTIREGLFFDKFYRYKTQVQKIEHLKVINIIRNIILKLAVKLVKLDQEFDPEIFKKNKKSWQVFLDLS